MEAINQESVVAPGDLKEAPISMTTTETNLTGSWKFFRPDVCFKASPCTTACPLHNSIRTCIQKILYNDPLGALEILRQSNPLPATTGRVCPNFCQQQCTRKDLDQEVLVGRIEQYLGDIGLDIPYASPGEERAEKVGIIGSGPAGLAAAYFLASRGVQVKIMEKETEPGGLLRYGIPAYRLPKDILDKEIQNLIRSLSIEIQCSALIAPKDISQLLQEFDYIFCAPGLSASVIPEQYSKNDRIYNALDLLKGIYKNELPSESSFAVIGGGNAAVDVARSLLRLGKEVQIIYRRSFDEMPAYPDEKNQAVAEGISIHEHQVLGSVQNTSGGLLLQIHQAEKQNNKIVPGKLIGDTQVEAMVLAIGQKKEMDFQQEQRIFLGGDYAHGAATVVEALASGKKAALDIMKNLGLDVQDEDISWPEAEDWQIDPEYLPPEAEITLPVAAISKRCQSFRELHPPPDREEVEVLAQRCLQCGTCTGCGICWFFCPDVAISLHPEAEDKKIEIDLQHCKGCGLCAQVCPRGVIQMQEDV